MDEAAGSIPVTSTNFRFHRLREKNGQQVRLRACGKGAPSFCHSERSEESLFDLSPGREGEIPSFVRNDKMGYFFRSVFQPNDPPAVSCSPIIYSSILAAKLERISSSTL